MLTQRQTSGEVDRVERGIRVLRCTGHLLVGLLVSDSGSAYREDEFGTGISARGGAACWRDGYREDLPVCP